MYYEVFIPSLSKDGFDTTITVEAENWMSALRSGLERTGEGSDIRNVMCDIKDDNSIHVTDASTRRVFVLKEVETVGSEDSADMATERIDLNDLPPLNTTNSPTPELRPSVTLKNPDQPTQPVQVQSPPPTPEPAKVVVNEPTPELVQPTPPPQPVKAPAPEPVKAAPAPEPVKAEPLATSEPTQPVAPVVAKQDPKPVIAPKSDFPPIEEGGGLAEKSWTSEDGRISIGSATYEALRRDEPAKVVRETRAPSGSRPAVELELGDDSSTVTQNIMEDVFLEIQRIHEGMEMEAVISYAMDLSMEKISAEAGSIMFADLTGTEMYFATARGPKAKQVMDFRIPMGAGIVGFCVKEGVSLSISDAEKDPRFYKQISEALGYETKNLCCAPVQHEGRVFGAIELLNKDRSFRPDEVSALTYIAAQLAKYIHDQIMAQEKL